MEGVKAPGREIDGETQPVVGDEIDHGLQFFRSEQRPGFLWQSLQLFPRHAQKRLQVHARLSGCAAGGGGDKKADVTYCRVSMKTVVLSNLPVSWPPLVLRRSVSGSSSGDMMMS